MLFALMVIDECDIHSKIFNIHDQGDFWLIIQTWVIMFILWDT